MKLSHVFSTSSFRALSLCLVRLLHFRGLRLIASVFCVTALPIAHLHAYVHDCHGIIVGGFVRIDPVSTLFFMLDRSSFPSHPFLYLGLAMSTTSLVRLVVCDARSSPLDSTMNACGSRVFAAEGGMHFSADRSLELIFPPIPHSPPLLSLSLFSFLSTMSVGLLYTPSQYSFNTRKALAVASYAGLEVEVSKDFVFGETNKSEEFLKKVRA
jgi:hypothetical protein